MNSALATVAFQSPSSNLQSNHQRQPRLIPQRRPEIYWKWRAPPGKLDFALKPVQATLGSNATDSVDNTDRRGNILPSSPLFDLIQEFYSSLNCKDGKWMEKLIAPDCIIVDTAYYKPLPVKNTRDYFRRLMKAMGNNVKFAIDEVSQGVEPTVAVMWHLEWNGKTIPFTRGCSFYVCSGSGAAFFIRKVHIFEESPVKPGKLGLEILSFITNLFDTFPTIAEGFLNNQEALAQSFVWIYKLTVKPLIVPFLAYYTHFWTYVAKGLTMVLNILYNVFKRFM